MSMTMSIEMSSHAYAIGLGVGLGVVGGAIHLAVTAWRARLVCRGESARAVLLLPFAFAGPALAVLGAAEVAPAAAWSTVAGIFLVRIATLARRRASDAC